MNDLEFFRAAVEAAEASLGEGISKAVVEVAEKTLALEVQGTVGLARHEEEIAACRSNSPENDRQTILLVTCDQQKEER